MDGAKCKQFAVLQFLNVIAGSMMNCISTQLPAQDQDFVSRCLTNMVLCLATVAWMSAGSPWKRPTHNFECHPTHPQFLKSPCFTQVTPSQFLRAVQMSNSVKACHACPGSAWVGLSFVHVTIEC